MKDENNVFGSGGVVEIDYVDYATMSYRSEQTISGFFTDDDIDHAEDVYNVGGDNVMEELKKNIRMVLDELGDDESAVRVKQGLLEMADEEGWSDELLEGVKIGFVIGMEETSNIVDTVIKIMEASGR